MQNQPTTLKEVINNYGATFAFIAAIIFFSFASRGFFSGQNLQNILVQSTSLGICAFGLTFVLITGEIDVSYGGVVGLVGAVLAGMLKDATSLLDAILSEREDIFSNNLLLTGRCLAGTPRIGRVELREQINADLKTLIEDENQHWLPRTQAMRIMSEADGEKVSKYLLNLLDNHEIHWRVRAAAADALGTIGRKDVVRDLLALLPDEQIDLNVRERIADVLADLCDETMVPWLLDLVSNQEVNPQIRGRIARTLGRLGYDTAASSLRDLLSDYHLAWPAGLALARLRMPMQPQELLALLRDKNLELKGRWALTKIANDLDSTAASEIVGWLSDDSIDKSIRWSIAYRLGRLGGVAIRDQMQELYYDESLNFSLRASIGVALLGLGETGLVTELKGLLANPNVYYYIRMKIAVALVRSGERDIAEQLMALLQEEDLRLLVRLRMIDLLVSLKDSMIAPRLLDFLGNEQADAHIRARAVDTLSVLDLNDLTADVKALVTDHRVDPLVRGRAAYCLAQDENGVAWLVELLERDDLREEVYLALHHASRQAGVRVFARPTGGYQVLPL